MRIISVIAAAFLLAGVSGCASHHTIWQQKTIDCDLLQVNQKVGKALVLCGYFESGNTRNGNDGQEFYWDVSIRTPNGSLPLQIVGKKALETRTSLKVGFQPANPLSEKYVQWLFNSAESKEDKLNCME